MSTKPTIAIVLLGIGLTATSLASIISTTRLNHMSMRCDDIEARLAACPSQTVGVTYSYGKDGSDGHLKHLDDWPHMKTLFRDADGKMVVYDPGGYDPRTRDGSGPCIFDGLRDQVAPGSRDRELTPDEETAFIKALDKDRGGYGIRETEGSEAMSDDALDLDAIEARANAATVGGPCL